MPRVLSVLIPVALLAFSGGALAAEPSYCDPATFYAQETATQGGPKRLHLFRLGKVWLGGLAVGGSYASSVRKLASTHSEAGASERYCTWYLNKGNPEAQKEFNWHYLSRPREDAEKSAAEFRRVLESSFDRDSTSFVSCAEDYGYLAMGCDGMKHRGPSAFAMLLAFTGCTPEHSVEIANELWGLNGVPNDTRLAIARAGYELGSERPESRARLARLFSR